MIGSGAQPPTAAGAVTVVDVPERRRYEARIGEDLAGLADYIPTSELVAFTHTEVLPGFEGRGIGSTLVLEALDDVRRKNLMALPVCPFVLAFIQRHQAEYADLVYRSTTTTVAD